MVQTLLESQFENVRLFHVRMSFSSSMVSVGRLELKKVWHMMEIVLKASVSRFQYKIDALYYVPGGSSKVPVIRDIFILFLIRSLFKKVIFHFHAAGVSEVVETLPWLLKKMAFKIYSASDLAIFLSSRNPDNTYFKLKKQIVVPNGITDVSPHYFLARERLNGLIKILFVGVVQESKGVKVLLEAITLLTAKGYGVKVEIVGEFSSSAFQQESEDFCKSKKLDKVVTFAGLQTGDEKWRRFANADIICFPSFFESESFGNVIVEAMMFQLPVVATAWRGIPDVVDENETGLLVPIKDPVALSEKLEMLINDPALRERLGKMGREKYLKNYQLQNFIKKLEQVFEQV